MRLTKPQDKPLLILLLKRTSTLFFVWILALLFLYVTGSIQGFLEVSMTSILSLLTGSAAFLTILAFLGCLADLFLLLYQRKLHWIVGLSAYLVLMAFALSVTFLFSGVGLYSGGL